MDAARLDFDARTNSDLYDEITVTVDGVTGIDLTDHSFRMVCKSGSIAWLTLETVASAQQGIYPVEPENGFIQIRIDKENLAAVFGDLNPAFFVGNEIRLDHDIVVTLPNGDVEVWWYGYLNLTKGVTNV